MSIRTIIEINHDYLNKLSDNDFQNLLLVLKGTRFHHELATKGAFDLTGGMRILAQRHHSDVLTLEVK